jgi:hypothetical protein
VESVPKIDQKGRTLVISDIIYSITVSAKWNLFLNENYLGCSTGFVRLEVKRLEVTRSSFTLSVVRLWGVHSMLVCISCFCAKDMPRQ